MKEKPNIDCEKYRQIAQMAKMGWWESDLKNRQYICSDFIIDLLGLESDRISFEDFHERIREDHRRRLRNEYFSLTNIETYEQMFPIRAKDGDIWVYSKISFKQPDEEGYKNMIGYLQCIDKQAGEMSESTDSLQVNSLLYQQNSLSYSLLAFLQSDDITQIINKILADLLKQTKGDRTYIFEIDREHKIQSCIYEATAEGISQELDFLQDVPWDDSLWWDRQISEKRSIILNTLDDMPPEAKVYRDTLEVQDIKSVMVVPLLSKDKVWGYMGIDMVRTHRSWSNIDHQWFSSLGNIISICLQLRKAELQAKEDRRALDHSEKILRNIYKNLPVGIELYDKDGYLVDMNDKELEIFGLADMKEALGVSLFENPNIPEDVKEKLRARENVDSFNDGISITKTEVNPETIVANQLAMYIRAYNFEEASILADKLPDTERFQMIKAFANCLDGYYDYRGAATVKEGEERKKVFKLVKESSPLNNIVMCMAMETDNYNKEAQKALEELPETAMTKYMKLVIYIREKKLYEWSYDNALDFDEACKKLEEIVKLDEKYYKIAVNDGEISKEFMEYYDQGDWKLY